jgi:DNA polymerase-3 subunit gamma/tau
VPRITRGLASLFCSRPQRIMYQVIARKYRPQSFVELIGQEHVRTTLANAIAQGRIAHGYIFSGQRGTGKTTVARILARCLNCETGVTSTPCMKCASCKEISAGGSVDVIEIDAASNRGINEMRELRENVRYRPARDRYKVFIIDEAHQITNEAFNALLKTLEEPPEWVVFMLCTTESHKIPTTISSRCQQFTFRSVEFQELITRMSWICGEEGIQADAETLAVLAQSGEGSVRDALSALDQAIACCGAKLDAAEVRGLLGLFSLDTLGEVARALDARDSRKMLEIVQELERNGHNLQHFCRELCRYFRNLLVAKLIGAGSRLIAASDTEQERLAKTAALFSEEDLTRFLQLTLDLYRDMQASLQPRLHLEIGLLRLVYAGRLTSIEEALAGVSSHGQPPPVSPAPRGPGGGTSPPRSSGGSQSASTRNFYSAASEETAPPGMPPPAPLEISRPANGHSSAKPIDGSLKARLLSDLNEQGQTFLADAVEHAQVEEASGEVRFTAPREFSLSLKSGELRAAVVKLLGRPVKICAIAGESDAAALPQAPPPSANSPVSTEENDVSGRALAHPEVQRFRQMFPGSHVRAVRNLKEWEQS